MWVGASGRPGFAPWRLSLHWGARRVSVSRSFDTLVPGHVFLHGVPAGPAQQLAGLSDIVTGGVSCTGARAAPRERGQRTEMLPSCEPGSGSPHAHLARLQEVSVLTTPGPDGAVCFVWQNLC